MGGLFFLVMAWASLLPVGLLLQALLPLPPPQGPLPYGGLTPHFAQERSDAYRCSIATSSGLMLSAKGLVLLWRQGENCCCIVPHNVLAHLSSNLQ